MSMNKVIHCAVRRDLRRFKTALEKFSDGDRARAAALHRAWQNFDPSSPTTTRASTRSPGRR